MVQKEFPQRHLKTEEIPSFFLHSKQRLLTAVEAYTSTCEELFAVFVSEDFKSEVREVDEFCLDVDFLLATDLRVTSVLEPFRLFFEPCGLSGYLGLGNRDVRSTFSAGF